jgi:uncharacterized protein
MFRHGLKAATIAGIAVLGGASFAMGQEGGRYWAPPTTSSGSTPAAGTSSSTSPVIHPPRRAATRDTHVVRHPVPRQSPPAGMASAIPQIKTHRLILQVNTNDAAAMNLALNNAMNVTQHFKELGEKVKIEVVTFGPGLHMVRQDTSPVRARIEEMALSTPEVSFKACGNTQQNMQKSENKTIPIIPEANVVPSGVVRVRELQEKGWSYVKP